MALPNGYDKLTKDFDSFWLKFYKSSYLSPDFQKLPRCWNVKDRSRSLRLSHFALTVSFSSGFNERNGLLKFGIGYFYFQIVVIVVRKQLVSVQMHLFL